MIEESVVVVVDERDSAAGGLDDELLGLVTAVGEHLREPGFGRDVFKSRLVDTRQEERDGQQLHCLGAFSPSFLRKSVNSPSGGRLSLSRMAFSRCASSIRPALR